MRRAAILLACVLVVALAPIVHRGGDSSRTAAGDTACTNDATAEAVNSANFAPRTPGAHVRFVTPDDEAHCRLRPALLTTADLPAGWSEGPAGVDRAYGQDDAVCRTPLPARIAGLTNAFDHDHGPDVEVIAQSVYAFKSGRAADLMAALKRNCSLLAAAGGDDRRSYGQIDLPTLGDESIGVHSWYGIPPKDGDRSVGTIYIRRGDIVTVLAVTTGGDSDVLRFAAVADAKLAMVGPMPEAAPVTGEGCVPTPTPLPGLSQEIGAGMLELEDLPVGWVHDPPGPCGRIDWESSCKSSGPPPPAPIAAVNTGFSGRGKARLVSGVSVYSASDAGLNMETLRRITGSPIHCTASLDGETFGLRYEPVTPPTVGEDAVAWHLTASGRTQDANFYVLMIRRGRTIARVALQSRASLFRSVDEPVPEEFGTFATLADSKLQAVQGSLSGD